MELKRSIRELALKQQLQQIEQRMNDRQDRPEEVTRKQMEHKVKAIQKRLIQLQSSKNSHY